MNDQDTIRKAVELADGFDYESDWGGDDVHVASLIGYFHIQDMPQCILDALAAQLVRQVDDLGGINLIPSVGSTEIMQNRNSLAYAATEGRTMNTIKAIIDSGVLEHD